MLSVTETAVASGNINTAGTLDFAQNEKYNCNREYALKKPYWHPDLSKRQMERLKAKIRNDVKTSDNSFTDKANWLFCDIEGLPVFAIYSTENTEEPTLLYESKDAQAEREKEILLDILEVKANGKSFNGKSGAFGTVSSRGWVQPSGNVQNSNGGLGGTRGSANAGVLRGQSKSKPSRAFINVIENFTAERGRVNNENEEAVDVGETSTASSSYPQSGGRQNSLKTEDLLCPDYGKAAETQQGDTSSTSQASAPSPQGEGSVDGSYIEETGLDTYFNDIEERAQVIQDKRIADAESALMSAPNTNKKTLPEKVRESVSFVKRKIVNSGDAIRKIAKTTKDGQGKRKSICILQMLFYDTVAVQSSNNCVITL